jgi:hypothetical protein
MVFANNTLDGISVRSPADGSKIGYTIENNTFPINYASVLQEENKPSNALL